jgi:hypothetical protein
LRIKILRSSESVNPYLSAPSASKKNEIKQVAQGEVFHNDDTTATILQVIRERRKREQDQGFQDAPDRKERTGTFTSGIVSIVQGRKTALFFTGRQQAGEYLRDILLRQAAGLAPSIQMCDGLARNALDLPEDLQVLHSNCTAHMRRQFVDVANRITEECRYVLEVLRDIYRNDAAARRQGISL